MPDKKEQELIGMSYSMEIAGLRRELPLCRVSDDLMIAGFVIFGDPELTVACGAALNKLAPEHDYMITAEAKGIPLIHEMARQAGEKTYFLARKSPKLYMREVFSVEVNSISTSVIQRLYLDADDAARLRGKRILIVDDVASTGESIRAVEQLIEKAGGTVCGRMAILAEGEARERDDLIYLEPLPVFNGDGTPKD